MVREVLDGRVMARIRTIKPTFFTSLTVAGISLSARLTFIGLWTYCDDSGRGRDDARLIKAAIWPLDDSHGTRRIETDLATLEKEGLIERYTVDGQTYIRIRSWKEHQRINRPTPSLLPPSPEESLSRHDRRTDGSPPEGNGSGRERNSDSRPPLSHDAGTNGSAAAPPETGATNSEAPWKGDPLVQRWCSEVTHNTRSPHQSATWQVVVHLRQYVEDSAIDEHIGRLAKLDKRPTNPNYLLTTVQGWASERNIVIPPLVRR